MMVLTRFWLSAILATMAAPALAQPRMDLPAPETIADRGVPGYRFETLRITSSDGERAYLVRLGLPEGEVPAKGRPALWLLDGKAALEFVDPALLTSGDAGTHPVIIAIGHDTPLRLDAAERVRDYTPGTGSSDGRGRPGGGADAFLEVIEHRIRPAIEARVHLDPSRQALWGHSLGGLFVLHALSERPDLFSLHFAASPSLWWNDGAIMDGGSTGLPPQSIRSLIVADGSGAGPDTARPGAKARRARFHVDPDREQAFWSEMEDRPDLTFSRIDYPGLGHGATFRASVPDALRALAALEGS
ncbi:MAG: prolyl oligopeptidase family serine peptidase [Erythrobacter sp.]|nr:prolyl oligopeptidase family serine peptidase [Erythrobacter sp.]